GYYGIVNQTVGGMPDLFGIRQRSVRCPLFILLIIGRILFQHKIKLLTIVHKIEYITIIRFFGICATGRLIEKLCPGGSSVGFPDFVILLVPGWAQIIRSPEQELAVQGFTEMRTHKPVDSSWIHLHRTGSRSVGL